MLMRRVILLVAALFGALPAVACTVTVIDTLKRTFQESDAVFVGRAENVETYSASFKVSEWFKGEESERVVLSTASSCDFAGFEQGKDYLVIARRDGAGLHADSGSHTTEITSETQSRVQVVRRRARWWQSCASRFAPFRAVSLIWRELSFALRG
jgi:hypothetical protein